MSSSTEERYVDLKKLCHRVDPELFEPLSWILILNLDLVPKEDLDINSNLKFSHSLMYGEVDTALNIAQTNAKKDTEIAKKYSKLLELDPKLEKTQEISEHFFAFARRRIELVEKLGIHQM